MSFVFAGRVCRGVVRVKVERDLANGIVTCVTGFARNVRDIFNRVAFNSRPKHVGKLCGVACRKSLVKFRVEENSFVRTVRRRPAFGKVVALSFYCLTDVPVRGELLENFGSRNRLRCSAPDECSRK